MRAVAEIEADFGMLRRQTVEDFVRVESNAGERVAEAVGGIESDRGCRRHELGDEAS